MFGNGQMLVVRTSEDRAHSLGQLVSCEQPLGLYNLALAMNPLGLHRVEPRALLGQKAAYDPHSLATVFNFSVVGGDPLSDLFGDVPGSVVPDQHPNLLARRSKLLAAPRKEAGGYGAHGAAIHKAQPHLLEPRHIQPVAGDGLRVGVVLGDRLLHQAQGLSCLAPTAQSRPGQPAEPSLVQETYDPLGEALGEANQPVAPPFFLWYSGSGLVIQRLARSQRTPILSKVARMVSLVIRLFVIPSSKLTSAAISSVHKVLSLPNFRVSLSYTVRTNADA